jgi:SpoIID/LytB domain protein
MPLAVAFTLAAPGAARADAGLVIDGRGFGHGVGMPQDGAHALAVAGADVDTILGTFYPGTSIGSRGGTVHAELLDHPVGSVVVALPSGGEVMGGGGDQPAGFPVEVGPGGSVRLALDGGRYRVTPLDGATPTPVAAPAPPPAAAPAAPAAPPPTTATTVPSLLGLIPLPPILAPSTTAPAPPTTAAPAAAATPDEPTSDGPVRVVPADGGLVALPELGRRYRGVVSASAAGSGLQLANDLDVEVYLRGMGEVLDSAWPAAALEAQAIAARTYALLSMATGRPLCSSQLCQVYLGETAEYGAMNRAVAATEGEVLTYHGALAEAVYSADAGGITATAEEGFGPGHGDFPYLQPVRYTTPDPVSWHVEMSWSELAARVGYPGTPSTARISRTGPSGRAVEVTIDGDAGPLVVDGLRFADALGLQSTLFELQVEADVQPGAQAPRAPSAALSRANGPITLLEAGVDRRPLGRAPWAAVAVLLVAAWATGFRAGRARATG